ncbi:MAG: tetratricopeptide repeat protein, partial [Pyrinomonadaceae bacterium]
INLRRRKDCSGASAKFRQATELNPLFVDGYNELGYTNLILDSSDIGEATANFEKAKASDPDQHQVYSPTLRNLGYCYFVQGRFEDAIKSLSEAYNRLQRAEISIKLGDAYRSIGDLKRAVFYHQLSLDGIERVIDANEQYYLGTATFVYLPQNREPPTAKAFVQIADRDQYRIVALYTLSLDEALEEKFDQASRRFEKAYKLDSNHLYGQFFAHEIQRLKTAGSRLSINEEIMKWFDDKLEKLSVEPKDDRVSNMCDK